MQINGTFYFDPADRIYVDHFPGNPVVPGSVIVHAFLKAGKESGHWQGSCILEAFRFKRFVSPGEHAYNIEFQRDGMKCRLFETISDESTELVTGIIRK
jgi:3-hydroxyacyl-[acyl-carrier-protein] dehydratase